MTNQLDSMQQVVQSVYQKVFPKNPLKLKKRLEDIGEEHDELQNYENIDNLKEELGDLICTCFQLATEQGWNINELIQENMVKLLKRHEEGHYKK